MLLLHELFLPEKAGVDFENFILYIPYSQCILVISLMNTPSNSLMAVGNSFISICFALCCFFPCVSEGKLFYLAGPCLMS